MIGPAKIRRWNTKVFPPLSPHGPPFVSLTTRKFPRCGYKRRRRLTAAIPVVDQSCPRDEAVPTVAAGAGAGRPAGRAAGGGGGEGRRGRGRRQGQEDALLREEQVGVREERGHKR